MIHLKFIDKVGVTQWCIACIQQNGSIDEKICKQCQGFRVTYYKCPVCHVADQFCGHDLPVACGCGYKWPDILDLEDNTAVRINYSIGA